MNIKRQNIQKNISSILFEEEYIFSCMGQFYLLGRLITLQCLYLESKCCVRKYDYQVDKG